MMLFIAFVLLLNSLSTEAIANPFYESIHCIDEKSNEIGEGDIAQCSTGTNGQYLCPIDSVACDKNDNFDAEPPECNEPKQFDNHVGLCSETLVNNAECPTGSVLSNDRCNGLLTQNASCPSGQSLKDDMCSATLNQSAGCPSGQTLQNDICTATLTTPPKCPSGQSFNSSNGRCSQTIYSNAQCPSGSSLSNDRCNGLLVQNARCPQGQSLKDGVCTVTLSHNAQCPSGGSLVNDKCQSTSQKPPSCPSGYNVVNNQCQKVQTETPTYSCPNGYNYNNATCSKNIKECKYSLNPSYYVMTSRGSSPKAYWNGKLVSSNALVYRNFIGNDGYTYVATSKAISHTYVDYYNICRFDTVVVDANKNCKNGWHVNGNMCELITTTPLSCPSGYKYNSSSKLCEKNSISNPICQSGYGYNFTTNRCEKTINTAPMCNTGYSFNLSSNKCEKTINTAPICQSGYTYSPAHNKCLKTITSSPFCQSGYTYNSNQKLCTKVVSSSPLCPSGYGYNVTTDRCEKTITSNPICNTGYHYNVVTNRCEKEIDTDPICPTGYDFNPKTDRCEKVITDAPKCPSGYGYNPTTKQCEKTWVTESCPYGSQFQCIPNGSASYCSPNQCFDPNTEKVEEDDDIDGSMLQNNGEVNEDGICLDQVYIFSGRAQKCRKRGTQTAFQDCCDTDGKVLKDGGGSSAQSKVTSHSISAIFQASSAAYDAIAAGSTMVEATNAFSAGFVGAFDPTSLAVSVAISLVMDYLAKACDQIETETALANSSSMCVYVGTYCKEKWLGKCVQRAKSYCCFNSQLAKIINEQGRLQLKSFEKIGNRGFGQVKSPECRGFTPEEFQSLDFSNIDMTEYYDEIIHKSQAEVQDTMEKMTTEYFNNVK